MFGRQTRQAGRPDRQADEAYHADRGTNRLGGEVGAELGADGARVAVGDGDLAPDDADLAAIDGTLSAVDKRNTLAEVELGRRKGRGWSASGVWEHTTHPTHHAAQSSGPPPRHACSPLSGGGLSHLCRVARLDTLDLDDGGVVRLVAEAATVAENNGLGVEPAREKRGGGRL